MSSADDEYIHSTTIYCSGRQRTQAAQPCHAERVELPAARVHRRNLATQVLASVGNETNVHKVLRRRTCPLLHHKGVPTQAVACLHSINE